ncbi:MAG: serine/threonine-protein kinase [Fuerstiella sp.]
MKKSKADCRDDLITALVQGSLEETQEVQIANHLNECDRCRQKLEQKTASSDLWQDLRQTLSEQPFDAASGLLSASHVLSKEASPEQLVQSSKSQRVQETSDDSATVLAPSIRYVLHSLAPTDDPEMLGRIGHHEVQGVIGAGGMGVVLKALDPSLDRMVAIKILAPHLATSGAARQRFAREAKAAAAVLHPNVVAIHGVSDGGTTGLPYLVMPYVRGATLQTRIDRNGGLSLTEILQVAVQVADGLAAAHQQGLVHRDIKPANIMLEDGVERVSITDFGLARTVDDATLTQSGVIAGTPQYMSPEQARGDSVDARSDLFSLGSLIYVMSAGHAPFRAETAYGILRRITDEAARPIREVRPDFPSWLAVLIDRLHAKFVSDRFQSATEVADVLRDCLAHVQSSSVPLPLAVRPVRTDSTVLHKAGLIVAAVAVAICSFASWSYLSADPSLSEQKGSSAQVGLNSSGVNERQATHPGGRVLENSESRRTRFTVPPSKFDVELSDAEVRQLLDSFSWSSQSELDSLKRKTDALDEATKEIFTPDSQR